MFIQPQTGQIVMLPEGGALPAEGQEVEPTQYWLRRLQDQDVVCIDTPQERKTPKTKETVS